MQRSEASQPSKIAETDDKEGNQGGNKFLFRTRGQTRRNPADALTSLKEHAYVVCITSRINDNIRYPFQGNEHLLDQILDSITHGDSVLLVGEPGIGKRTMSLGLARRLNALRLSHPADPVFSRDVYTLSLGSSFWNGAQSEDITDIQHNIRLVFQLLEEAGPEKIIFCIDDIDVLSFVDRLVKENHDDGRETGELARDIADSSVSIENMLRFLLFSKKVLCLCTCIKRAYLRLQRTDTYYDEKFTKSFRILPMAEPSFQLSRDIMFAHRHRLEAKYRVTIPDDTLEAVILYGKVYMTHRALPESALDLLQEACKRANLSTSNQVEEVPRGETMEATQKVEPRLLADVVVYKHFVDNLLTEWCGVLQEQLDQCFEELDRLAS